jgi:hypothetical protein
LQLPLDSLNRAVLASTHNGLRVGEPDNALDRLLMGKIFALRCKKTWFSVGTVEIEDANLLLLVASYNLGSGGGDVDRANDVVVWKGMEGFTGVRVPDFTGETSL